MKFVWFDVYKFQPEMPKFHSNQHCCLEIAAESSQRYWELQNVEQWGEMHEELEDWEKEERDYVYEEFDAYDAGLISRSELIEYIVSMADCLAPDLEC